MLGGKLHCYVVTPTLIVVQKLLKCDVTLLSIYNSDWSQKGEFNPCNIITLDALLLLYKVEVTSTLTVLRKNGVINREILNRGFLKQK